MCALYCLVAALAADSLGYALGRCDGRLFACSSFLPCLLLTDMLPRPRDLHLRTQRACCSASTQPRYFPLSPSCLLFLYQSCHRCCLRPLLHAARLTSSPFASVATSQRKQNNKVILEARKAPLGCLPRQLSIAVATGRLQAESPASRCFCVFLLRPSLPHLHPHFPIITDTRLPPRSFRLAPFLHRFIFVLQCTPFLGTFLTKTCMPTGCAVFLLHLPQSPTNQQSNT
jgi:hypothetical protein